MRNRRLNLVIGTALVLLCGVVAAVAMNGSKSTQVPFRELPRTAGERTEVYGKLETRSIVSLKGANLVRFSLVDEKSGDRLDVLYDNPAAGLSANFPNASHARVFGVYNAAENRFVADQVITKCPSKYDNQEYDLEALQRRKATEEWQKATGLTGSDQ